MKPYKIYGEENIDGKAINQFFNAMELGWVTRGALMPDAHLGYALPIGGVVATDGVVVPSWVGYDIGCGVCAVPISCNVDDIRAYSQEIYQEIYRQVPVGFNHGEKVTWREYSTLDKTEWFDNIFHEKGGLKQLGTLGGGNHFIEIGADETDIPWVIVHSGSRNVGHTTATNYMREASFLHTGVRKAKEGHFGFEMNSDLGMAYVKDLQVCEKFALKNRLTIVDRVMNAINYCLPGTDEKAVVINRNHNHIEFTDEGVIHRKGATHAKKGMLGVIPGNMRDGSFIVRGLGNPDSLSSSSHGAGRLLGRKQAKDLLAKEPERLDKFIDEMDDLNITSCASEKVIDESPMSYKDIWAVMEYQKELVDVITYIKPIINIKG